MKDIPNYEDLYAASEDGHIWSYKSKKFLKEQTFRGYKTVKLFKDGIGKHQRVHRLIALAFIPNDDPAKDQINHKDKNRSNNLEWCTQQYNIEYSLAKKVLCVETQEVFDSIVKAAEAKGTKPANINRCLRGKTKTSAKLHWRYLDREE